MPAHDDLDLLIEAARAAGQTALQFTGARARRWEKPDGTGLVTEADLAVNALLEDRLRCARADYGWLSEESEDDPARLAREAVFVVDPIDGTRGFAQGSSDWAHSLAIARGGRVTEAVIFLPARDKLYVARAGGGARLNGAPVKVSGRATLAGAEILTSRAAMDPRHWRAGPPRIRRAHRPSLAYRMALVAQGRYDGILTVFPSWEWDIAAGDLILREAGAEVTDKTGHPLAFNNPQPRLPGVVAAPRKLHAAFLANLKAG